MGHSAVTYLTFLVCFLAGLQSVLEGSVINKPSYAELAESAAKLDGRFLQVVSSAIESTEIERHENTSRVQCALRCKRKQECVDVVYNEDGVCLLLGRTTNGTKVQKGVMAFSPVVIGTIYFFLCRG